MKKILITGAAGFIGYHLFEALIKDGRSSIVGIDNFNDYYDPKLKYDRLNRLNISIRKSSSCSESLQNNSLEYKFLTCDVRDYTELVKIFRTEKFDTVVHLAAQAGVRYSLSNPRTYIENNLNGFFNVIDLSKEYDIGHFIYASSSSVYGNSKRIPFDEKDMVDYPISLYAATKKSNELIAHTYSHLYDLPTTGLRFFTVFGPWGRPDMAMYSFTKNILEGQPIEIYNNGDLYRDFTFVDDIIAGIQIVLENLPVKDRHFDTDTFSSEYGETSFYRVLNLGNSSPIHLIDFVNTLENELGINAIKTYRQMQPGDVNFTQANIEKAKQIGYKPSVSFQEGVKKFVKWFREYYGYT